MRLPKKTTMDWESISDKLRKGMALVDRHKTTVQTANATLSLEKAAVRAAQAGGNFDGFGQASLVEQLQTGELFPDQIAGFSTKTVLVLIVLLLLLKLKKLQGA
jgi:hypothetical protein